MAKSGPEGGGAIKSDRDHRRDQSTNRLGLPCPPLPRRTNVRWNDDSATSTPCDYVRGVNEFTAAALNVSTIGFTSRTQGLLPWCSHAGLASKHDCANLVNQHANHLVRVSLNLTLDLEHFHLRLFDEVPSVAFHLFQPGTSMFSTVRRAQPCTSRFPFRPHHAPLSVEPVSAYAHRKPCRRLLSLPQAACRCWSWASRP